MKIWIGGELKKDIHEIYRIMRNQIEKSLNAYLEEIGYKNDEIEKMRVVFVIREDDFSVMQHKKEVVKKDRGKPIYGMNFCLDYDDFKNGDENKRKIIIYKGLLKALDLLEEQKKIQNLDIIKEYINEQILSL